MIDKLVESTHAKFKLAESLRAPFNADWEDVRNYVRPITVAFNPNTGGFNSVRTEHMFDGTAPEALEELGSALHSYLTNPAERWFEIQLEGVPKHSLTSEEAEWLDEVSEIIYSSYCRSDSSFNLALHECYMDVGSFGTGVVCQEWDTDNSNLVFYAKPLQHCFFLEDSKGRVDTMFIRYYWTIRQIKQEFGEVLPPNLMKQKNNEKTFEIIHAVYPRSGAMPGRYDARNKRFASIWYCKETMELLYESGYDSNPYHVPRWLKLSGEPYGRGPAKKCIADIKMLNAMERTVLKAGQKAVDPPLVLANEGFMLPIKTSPGSLIFKEEEERKIEPLLFSGNLPWAEDKCAQKRAFIEKCFYIDWIRREKKRAEQTAYEVNDERDEMLRQLAPIFGRLVTELHGPMIARSYDLLNSHARFPQAPVSLQRRKLKVGYLSTAALAQIGGRANTLGRFLQDLVPLAQIDPNIMDIVDMDAAAQEYANARGIPRRVLRSADEMKGLREQKQKMQQMQQLAAVAEPASKAIKNIADAQETGMV